MAAQIIGTDRLENAGPFPALSLAVGFFDGVHRGHRRLLREMRRRSGEKTAVLTFTNHPYTLVNPQETPRLLTLFEEKARLLAETGIDFIFWAEFTPEIRNMTKEHFLHLLQNRLQVKRLFLGGDHRFGFNSEGDMDFLKTQDIRIYSPPPCCIDGIPVSSTRIRKEIGAGNMKTANKLLGYNYFITAGESRSGAFSVSAEKLLPAPGNYSCLNGGKVLKVKIQDKRKIIIEQIQTNIENGAQVEFTG